MKKSRILILILPIVILILEALPWGVVLNFAVDGGGVVRRTYSCFSIKPFGYANFGPFVTAVLSCGLMLTALLYCFTGKAKFGGMTKDLSMIAFVSSFMPLVLGIRYYTWVNAAVGACLLGQWFYLRYVGRKENGT